MSKKQTAFTHHSLLITFLLITFFEEVEDGTILKAALVVPEGDEEDFERAHSLVFERVGLLRHVDVCGAEERERETLHPLLLFGPRRPALHLNQLQLDRPRRFGADAKLRVQVLRENFLRQILSHIVRAPG